MLRQISFCLLAVSSLVWGVALADTTVPPPLSVEIDQNVHFANINGEDVVIKPGVYEVWGEEESIRLTKKNTEEKAKPMVIRARTIDSDKNLEQPQASATLIGEDELHVVIEFPGGRGLGAIGSFSGIRSRAARVSKPEDAYIIVYKDKGFKGRSKRIRFKDGGQVFLKNCLHNKISSFILVAPRGVSITGIDRHKLCFSCKDRQATWWGWGVAHKVDKRDLKHWGLHDDISGFTWRVDGRVPYCKNCKNMYQAKLNYPRC